MTVYIVNMFVVFISSLCANLAAQRKGIGHEVQYRPSYYFIFVAITSLAVVAGLRRGVGTDYFTYHGLIGYFYSLELSQIFSGGGFGDRGFTLLTWVIGRFTDEPQVAFFVFAAIIIWFVVFTIKDFGAPFELSMLLYIMGLSYYSSFNGLRQWIAAAVLFWAVRYIMQGSWKKYLLFVCIVSLIHLSAMIMFLAYILVRAPKWKHVATILSLFFAGAFFMYSGFINNIFVFLDGSQYGHYSEVLIHTDNGANFLRILVWAVPVTAYILFRNHFERAWPESKYVFRMSFIGFLFAFLALKNASIYRICIYFDIYNVLLVPRLTQFFNRKINRFIYFSIVVCYFVYSYLVLPYDSNLLPYRFFRLFE